MADRVPTTLLTREVLPPDKPSSGFGVMLVASLAMFFAVASSAFVARARAMQTCPRGQEVERVAPRAAASERIGAQWTSVPRAVAGDCRPTEYRTNADGSTTWFLESCPEVQTPPARPTARNPMIIEVREIR